MNPWKSNLAQSNIKKVYLSFLLKIKNVFTDYCVKSEKSEHYQISNQWMLDWSQMSQTQRVRKK